MFHRLCAFIQPVFLISMLAGAGSVGAQPVSTVKAPEVLARAVLAGSLNQDTSVNVSVRLEDRTIGQGVHEWWVIVDGTATTEENEYAFTLELGVPDDVTVTVQPGSGGSTLVFASAGSACSVVMQDTSAPLGGGDVVIVTADDQQSGLSLAGAVTDGNTQDTLSPIDAFEQGMLLAVVSHVVCNTSCSPSFEDAHRTAGSDCKPDGIKKFTYSCSRSGDVSFSWECKDSASQ